MAEVKVSWPVGEEVVSLSWHFGIPCNTFKTHWCQCSTPGPGKISDSGSVPQAWGIIEKLHM